MPLPKDPWDDPLEFARLWMNRIDEACFHLQRSLTLQERQSIQTDLIRLWVDLKKCLLLSQTHVPTMVISKDEFLPPVWPFEPPAPLKLPEWLMPKPANLPLPDARAIPMPPPVYPKPSPSDPVLHEPQAADVIRWGLSGSGRPMTIADYSRSFPIDPETVRQMRDEPTVREVLMRQQVDRMLLERQGPTPSTLTSAPSASDPVPRPSGPGCPSCTP